MTAGPVDQQPSAARLALENSTQHCLRLVGLQLLSRVLVIVRFRIMQPAVAGAMKVCGTLHALCAAVLGLRRMTVG